MNEGSSWNFCIKNTAQYWRVKDARSLELMQLCKNKWMVQTSSWSSIFRLNGYKSASFHYAIFTREVVFLLNRHDGKLTTADWISSERVQREATNIRIPVKLDEGLRTSFNSTGFLRNKKKTKFFNPMTDFIEIDKRNQ